MVTQPAPTDRNPENPHPDPLGQGTQETLRISTNTAQIAAAVIAKAHQRNMSSIRNAIDQVREMMRRIREVFPKGRLDRQKLRENLDPRQGKGGPSGPQPSADGPQRGQGQGEQEKNSRNNEGNNKKESTGRNPNFGESQAVDMVRVLSSRLDADGAMALWGLAVQEKGKFADKVAGIAEDRLRGFDPEMMKVFDESREKGKGRLEAMSDSLKSHPNVGPDFLEALKEMDKRTQFHKAELQEARLVNTVEDLQEKQKLKGGPELSSSEIKEHIKNNPHPLSGPYPDGLVDKVTGEKYRPSKGVKHAQNILRAEESEQKKKERETPDKKNEDKKGRGEGRDNNKGRRRGRGRGGPQTQGKPNPKRTSGQSNEGPRKKNGGGNRREQGRGRRV